MNDGKRIFLNRMIWYPIECYQQNMISINQLWLKDLGIFDHKRDTGDLKDRTPEVKCAILHTMCFDQDVIKPLIDTKIPITLFKEGSDRHMPETTLIDRDDDLNINYVN